MADIKSREERSCNMSRIKGKDTKPEEYIRKLLFSQGFRYRKNAASLPGHPDVWMARYRLAIFVNGCFWHRHPGCKYAYTPKSNVEFWNYKFNRNVQRDKREIQQLLSQNIRCLIVWECTIKNMMKSEEVQRVRMNEIIGFMNSSESYKEI